MKKVVLLITVLFVSVISTACINNLAVQELNNKAKQYMANGEPEKAICRLRSSIDLDTSIFETHYNLGVALLEVKEYKDAIESFNNAIKLKPEFADSYYSLAIAYENQADSIINKDDSKEDASDDQEEDKTIEEKENQELTVNEKTEIVENYNHAIENYNKYLAKNPKAEEKAKIESQISYINEQIEKYNTERSTSLSENDFASGNKE